MSVYDLNNLQELLQQNTYPGRGIVIGVSEDGKNAVSAYFIMGRSANSRNRVFREMENGDLITAPFDESKVEDPSLIIYNAVRKFGNHLIVTNGDQTDTIYDALASGKSFLDACETRQFEPDAPNLTPRISGVLVFPGTGLRYQMSILKSADAEGTACNRYYFRYTGLAGVGHFLHTYNCDGNPIPTFTGEPERVAIGSDIDAFANMMWENLNEQNKISLYVRYDNLETGEVQKRIFNKNV